MYIEEIIETPAEEIITEEIVETPAEEVVVEEVVTEEVVVETE